eukprot:TRINITY_DN19588_c0_g1_i8.p2 TRINITY_DN19588_c0_g1~~TRINITY_DN19588_c0_g1_i8.p2  ORF type:complete len:208 (-),score=7.98 TRINITY_DN19588_c0_g1_i8:279-902(-)
MLKQFNNIKTYPNHDAQHSLHIISTLINLNITKEKIIIKKMQTYNSTLFRLIFVAVVPGQIKNITDAKDQNQKIVKKSIKNIYFRFFEINTSKQNNQYQQVKQQFKINSPIKTKKKSILFPQRKNQQYSNDQDFARNLEPTELFESLASLILQYVHSSPLKIYQVRKNQQQQQSKTQSNFFFLQRQQIRVRKEAKLHRQNVPPSCPH